MSSIESFLRRLQQQPNSDTVTNPYRNAHCVDNLRHYLQLMKQQQPKILLVGEAPGYKGCGLTGIPFSSGKLFQQVDHPLLKKLKSSLVLPQLESENTASIVWRYLAERQVTPLFWNAYPFHPHPSGNRQKNRAPNRREVEAGGWYLQQMVALFSPEQVAGVGHAGTNCARKVLENYTINYIRHPSYGGKGDFVAGMDRLYQSTVISS